MNNIPSLITNEHILDSYFDMTANNTSRTLVREFTRPKLNSYHISEEDN